MTVARGEGVEYVTVIPEGDTNRALVNAFNLASRGRSNS